MADPLVSVVVTTRNEEKNIGNCLLSIQEQTYSNMETIVVDNGSTDRTKEIAREYTQHVYDKGPERSAQRNYGMIEIAKGDYVMFIDADMILAPCLIEECVEEIEQKQAVALYISEVILGSTYWCRVRKFERSFYDATVIDSARFFRRDIFCSVTGFDVGIDFGEEWDIDKKIKLFGRIHLLDKKTSKECSLRCWCLEAFVKERGVDVIMSNVIFHNESDFRLARYVLKKGNYAKGFDKYIAKWGKNDPDIRRQFGLWYRYFGVFIENGKWKRLIANIYLTIGMYFLRVMVGLMFLYKR